MAEARRIEADGVFLSAEYEGAALLVLTILFLRTVEKLAAAPADEIGDFATQKTGIGLVDGDIAQLAVLDIGRGIQISDPAASQLQKFPG
jgi:hypothetical protein